MRKLLLFIILVSTAIAAHAAAPLSIQQFFQDAPVETAPQGSTRIITVRGGTVRQLSYTSVTSFGALSGYPSDNALLESLLDSKAPTAHTQDISTVNGLQDALDAKAETSALGTAAFANLTSLATAAQGAKADKITADKVFATDYNGGALNSATLSAAVTAIGSSAKTLVIASGNWSITGAVSFPSTLTVEVQPGAVFVDAGGSLSIQGPFRADPNRTCFSGFADFADVDFGPATKDIYMQWFGLADDGADDYTAIQAAFYSVSGYQRIWAPVSGSYNVSALTYIRANGVELMLRESKFVTGTSNGFVTFRAGTITSYTSQAISLTAGVNTFTIPGGVTAAVGNLVFFTASTEFVAGYKYRFMSRINRISGGTAYLDHVPKHTFTASSLDVSTGLKSPIVDGGIIDMTANVGATNTTAITMHHVTDGVVRNVEAKGSDYSGVAVSLDANIGSKVHNCVFDNFLSKAGDAWGGRLGYGVLGVGQNLHVHHNTIHNTKHAFAGGSALTNVLIEDNIIVNDVARGSELTETVTPTWLFSAPLDLHEYSEDGFFARNYVDSPSYSMVLMRNSTMRLSNNTIIQRNGGQTATSFIDDSAVTPSYLYLEGNTLVTEMNIDIMPAALKAVLHWGDGNTMEGFTDSIPIHATFGVGVNGFVPGPTAAEGKFLKDDGTWAVPATASPGGSSGHVQYRDSTGAFAGTANIFYDAANSSVGIFQSAPGTGTHTYILAPASNRTSGTRISRPQPDLTASGRKSNLLVEATINPSGTPHASSAYAVEETNAFWAHASNTLPTLFGKYITARNTSAGAVTTLLGQSIYVANTSTGTVGDMVGYRAESPTNAGTITGAIHGVRVYNQGLGGVSASYGMKIENQSGSTNSYAIYTGTGAVRFGDEVTAPAMVATRYKETVKANGTCSTSINIDPSLGGMHTLTLTGACAIGVTNLQAGDSFTLRLTQGATTAPTFTAAYKWPSGVAPAWSTAAATDVLSCYSDDGTTLLCNGMVDMK